MARLTTQIQSLRASRRTARRTTAGKAATV
jgi:hypothetical protein